MWHDAFKKPHDACVYNQFDILKSQKCGCFYCHEIYEARLVNEFTSEREGRPGTAICPKCGIDCVMPDTSGFPMERAFLEIQGGYWFNSIRAARPNSKYWLQQLKKAGYHNGEVSNEEAK